MVSLIKLTENDKRLIILLLLVFILLFIIVGYVSLLIKKIMKKQGSKADEMLRNVVDVNYFDNEKSLIKFGIKKNMRVFYREARVPFLIILVAWVAYILYCLFLEKWGYNPFNNTDGFGTLFYDLSDWPKTDFFGLTIINGFPSAVNPPHFEVAAIFSYIFVPANIVGCIWFLIYVQAYMARSFRIYKIAHGIFRKKLVPEEPTQSVDNNQQSL